jgi:hypothetical protein
MALCLRPCLLRLLRRELLRAFATLDDSTPQRRISELRVWSYEPFIVFAPSSSGYTSGQNLARPLACATGLAPRWSRSSRAGLASALVSLLRWPRSSRADVARPVACATGLAPRWSRSSRADVARPVACAAGLAPRWSRSPRAGLAPRWPRDRLARRQLP